ncbi:hypothetical protein AB0O20_06480 [Streptomyces kronopolitis]|uniref:hypothetical protein n=1 Tax=Streptomyces kronopolitis TaxID=1612435 RepID=UPI003426D8DE
MTEWESSKRGAKKFAAAVVPGKTYYSIHTAKYPWGEEQVWRTWEFNERQWLTGAKMSGAVSAEGACLRYGPMYDERPGRHIRPMFECDDEALHATPADIIKVRNSRREKARR